MNKYLAKKKIIVLLFGLLMCISICLTAHAEEPNLSPAGNAAIEGLNTSAGEKGAGLNTKTTDIPGLIGNLVGSALSFVGVVFFLIIIYGGVMWMTARGDEEKVNKAKALIEQAAVGLIIIASAYLITKYVGNLLLNPPAQTAPSKPQ